MSGRRSSDRAGGSGDRRGQSSHSGGRSDEDRDTSAGGSRGRSSHSADEDRDSSAGGSRGRRQWWTQYPYRRGSSGAAKAKPKPKPKPKPPASPPPPDLVASHTPTTPPLVGPLRAPESSGSGGPSQSSPGQGSSEAPRGQLVHIANIRATAEDAVSGKPLPVG